MADKLLNKEIREEDPGVSGDLRYTIDSSQYTIYLKPMFYLL